MDHTTQHPTSEAAAETAQLVAALRARIAASHFTVTTFAAAAGIPPRSFARRLAETVEFKIHELARVAAALGVRPSELFRAEGPEVDQVPAETTEYMEQLLNGEPPIVLHRVTLSQDGSAVAACGQRMTSRQVDLNGSSQSSRNPRRARVICERCAASKPTQ